MNRIVCSVASALWIGAAVGYAAEASDNPYAYDVSKLRSFDTNLLAYQEAAPLACVVTGAHALAVFAADDTLFVGGDRDAAFLRSDGSVLARFAPNGAVSCAAFLPYGSLAAGLREHVEVVDRKGVVTGAWVGMGENAVLTSLAVCSNDVFVADAGNRAVWRFDDEGRLRGQWGQGRDSEKHPFVVPSPYFDVILAAGSVWVANPGRLRVERFTLEGERLGAWGTSGMKMDGFCGCCNPCQLAAMPDGSFVTGEKGMPRVKVLDTNGVLRCVVAGPDCFDSDQENAASDSIRDVAVDSRGRVLVLDGVRNQIRVFVRKPEWTGR
jgi:hypothetical protein